MTFLDDDLATMHAGPLAVDATLANATIRVFFDNGYLSAQFADDGLATRQPQATCKDADVEDVVLGNTLIVGGVTYYVRAIEPDGTGETVLVLSKD